MSVSNSPQTYNYPKIKLKKTMFTLIHLYKLVFIINIPKLVKYRPV